MTGAVRTLLFSTLYPSGGAPLRGIFVETRLRELLRRHGDIETKVVAPIPWYWSRDPARGHHATLASAPEREHRHGIEVLHPRYLVLPKVGMNVAPFLLALGARPAVARLLREGFDFDLIDAHYFYPDGVAAAFLARWFDKPLAITARGTDVNLIPDHRWPRALIRWAAGRAAASIGVSEALVERMRQIGLPSDRLRVMRNGVDLERFRPVPPSSARSALGLPEGPALLCVGNLHEHKGQRVVLEAFALLAPARPDLQLIFVGDGEDRQWLSRRAVELGLSSRVRLAGTVPNSELSPWYSAADALVLASSREGWPNVLLEAMACGTPVVASRVGGVPEIVRSSEVGRLVAVREPAAFASAIAETLDAGTDRTAVRNYAAQFGWDRTSLDQAELFHSMRAAG